MSPGTAITNHSPDAKTSGSSAPPAAFRLSVLTPVYNERHVVEASLRRVLALDHPLIRSLELIVVDDCSQDGTKEVLENLVTQDSRIRLIRHQRNQGKGAALRTAIAAASGDVCIVHDADFEYNPADIPALLVPFAEEGADAVFGSRYLTAAYRRALMHRHTLMNKWLTALSNWFTDLHLTDLETGYKAINTTLLQSIPLRSNDFRFEVEITFKLAKRGARIFEVPIRYLPRTREEGKKIGAWDGILALGAMIRFSLIDDLYQNDEYGSRLLSELDKARRFTFWVGKTLRPYLGDRILEVGAGVASLTHQFIPRELYVAGEANPNYLRYLRAYALGKPYLHVIEIDPSNPDSLAGMQGEFDTVILLNVLESVPDPEATLHALHDCLQTKGRLLVQVPQGKGRFGSLDEARGRRMRFEEDELKALLARAGLSVEAMLDFNRLSVPGWWINTRLFHRKRFSRVQLKLLDSVLPILRPWDGIWPWRGLSLIAVAVKS
ncbi:MAG TPA: glycosyltransferase [Terriglobales bacterium]|nr:glycosyltransferase [Terriglobales bacterium]